MIDKFIDAMVPAVIKSCFIACIIVAITCVLSFSMINWRVDQINDELAAEINAYMTAATAEEYDEILAEIRHDLVFRYLDKDMELIIEKIPNTAECCPTCQGIYTAQVYFVALNNGNLYQLEIASDYNAESEEVFVRPLFGYDEVSQSQLEIYQEAGSSSAYLRQGRDIVSILRMKTIFCDECLKEILTTIECQPINAFVLFVPATGEFYAAGEDRGEQLGDCWLTVSADSARGVAKIRLDKISGAIYN